MMHSPGAELLVVGGSVLALGLGLASSRLQSRWTEHSLRLWAVGRGYQITAIEDAPWLDRYSALPFEQAFRVSIIDEWGEARRCKAYVGLIPTGRRGWVRASWLAIIKGR